MKNQEKKVFDQINLILNQEQSKKVNSHIRESIQENLFPEKNNTSFLIYNEKLINHIAGDHILSFYPEKRELRLGLPDFWALHFKSGQEKNFINLTSPGGRKLNIQISQGKELFIKINCTFTSIAFAADKTGTSLMSFDIRNFKIERTVFTACSSTDFNLYVNKEVYKDNNDRKDVRQYRKTMATKFMENAIDLLSIPILSIEVGKNILPFVDPASGAELLERMNAVRKFIALEMGIIIPPVNFRDNLLLGHNNYLIKVKGIEVARGEVIPDRLLAIGPEHLLKTLEGTGCSDPVYSMPAVWIEEDQRSKAEPVCMVFDAVNVIATQFTEVTRSHAAELVGMDEVSLLLENLKKTHPVLVKEIYPEKLNLGEIHKILKNLLKERVSIRNLPEILESLNNNIDNTKNPDLLTEYVRDTLCDVITRDYVIDKNIITVMTVDKKIEHIILRGGHISERTVSVNLSPAITQKILEVLQEGSVYMRQKGFYPVLVCSPAVRPYLRKLTERVMPELTILSGNNISAAVKINYLESINLSHLPFLRITRKIRHICGYIIKSIMPGNNVRKNYEEGKGENKISDEEIDYLSRRLDITKEEAAEVLEKHDKPEEISNELKEQLDVTEGKDLIMDHQVETLISWLEVEVSSKIKKIIHETGVSSYEAFMALNETKGDVESSINIIKSSRDGDDENNGEYKYNDYHHLLFEPDIWQKIDYIMEETLCNLSEAFKTLIEFQEDEEVAAKVILERRQQL
ncbi:MAG: FHIPEP family type III secretion protein [Candidatus Eremiobacterota bacterium]